MGWEVGLEIIAFRKFSVLRHLIVASLPSKFVQHFDLADRPDFVRGWHPRLLQIIIFPAAFGFLIVFVFFFCTVFLIIIHLIGIITQLIPIPRSEIN